MKELREALDKAVAEMVINRSLAVEGLTERQVAEAIKQALLSGDFVRHVQLDRTFGTEKQAVTYIPYRDLDRMRDQRDRLLHALKTVLPLARGYASAHPVGKNSQIVRWAECIAENPSQELQELE